MGEPFKLEKKWSEKPMVIVCGLINQDVGIVHMEMRQKDKEFKAFKAVDLVDIMHDLAAAYKDRRIMIFMDNASIHKAKVIKDACEELDITVVFNMPYSPHLMGIESFWGKAKLKYRAVLGQKKINGIDFDNLTLVEDVLAELGDETKKDCARHGWRMLQNAQPIQKDEELK